MDEYDKLKRIRGGRKGDKKIPVGMNCLPLTSKTPTNGNAKSTDSSIPLGTNEWCDRAQFTSLAKSKPGALAVQIEAHAVIVMNAIP
jgi:hypothetical protein